MQSKRSFVASIVVSGVLSACITVGPDYAVPEQALPAAWRNGVTSATPADITAWWRRLNDANLNALIERALLASPDVRTAQSRLREARARRGLAAAQDAPTLDAASNVRRSGTRTDTNNTTSTQYSAAFDASWEIDVFGGRRRAQEAAAANVQAAQADLDGARVSLAAEVARIYVQLRADEARLLTTRANLASREETLQLTRWRMEAGFLSSLEARQAQASVEQTRASIPAIERSIEDGRLALVALLGQDRDEVIALLSTRASIPSANDEIAIGIPADSLRQRPDVRAAERRLAAQTAQIGVAEAARYPSFRLSGSIGLQALSPAGVLSADTITSSLLGSIAAPLIDGGRIRQNVEIQNAAQEQALINYQSALIQALVEVEGALSAYAKSGDRIGSLREAELSAREAAELAQYQYAAGLTSLLTVLDTQRTLLSAQDQLAAGQADRTTALVQLYKALGGGWQGGASDSTQ